MYRTEPLIFWSLPKYMSSFASRKSVDESISRRRLARIGVESCSETSDVPATVSTVRPWMNERIEFFTAILPGPAASVILSGSARYDSE